VQGVGPATVLGGRYALRSRLSQDRDVERWSAHDTTLEREITLTIIGPEHPNRAGVLDAARRAAGVEDARLVRILDVGTQNDNSFIVEEAMSGSESLATILLQGPLPSEEARRVAGETAKGLETAGQRGLHHLRLTPHNVMISPDGAIRVSGVAVAAATAGPEAQEPDAATASRRDALCLVAIVYAALTSRWPLVEEGSGVEPAPRMVEGVVAPSEIAAGVPEDLDALCRMTLNEADGPLTPGDFANRIAPWSRERVHRAGVKPTVVLHLPGADEITGDVPVVAGTAADPVSGKPSSFAGSAEEGARTDSGQDGGRMSLPSGLSSQFDDVEPPLPLLPTSTALPPSRSQTRLVVLVVAAFVGLTFFVGYRGLIGPGSNTSLSKPTPTPTRTVTMSAPTVTMPASPAPQAAATAAGPIAILSATGFDPQGDHKESNGQAPRVYDGNLATSWRSETYQTAQFGDLKKGVGVLLDLGQPTSVHQVTLDLGSGPVDVTVYAATDPSLQGATVIGTASAASGQIQLKAAGAMPETQYVIVWFTSLAQDGSQFRASLSEIALN
jgi:eukaryotic-like serine/threonine-protein kinase